MYEYFLQLIIFEMDKDSDTVNKIYLIFIKKYQILNFFQFISLYNVIKIRI